MIYRAITDISRPIVGFVDSDFARNMGTRKSLLIMCSPYETAISWKSNLQAVVASSTTEAENITVTKAVKESM